MEGHYVDMAELCPEYLEEINVNEEESPRASKPKQRECSNILDWVQAFGTYVAIRSRSQPQHVPSLLAYQHLVIHSHTHFKDFDWASYDHQFRQKAPVSPDIDWSTMDGTLWNLCRTGGAPQMPQGARPPSYNSRPICLDWNEYPSPGCPHRNCRFEHICYRCVNLPSHINRRHKAVFCPNKDKNPQQNLNQPGTNSSH